MPGYVKIAIVIWWAGVDMIAKCVQIKPGKTWRREKSVWLQFVLAVTIVSLFDKVIQTVSALIPQF